MDEMTNEQGITPVDLVEDDVTPAGESVPRRFAMQSIVGGFAGLAALAAASDVGAQTKKKSTKKKSSKQKAQAKNARSGQLNRIRQILETRSAPTGDTRITATCPSPRKNERVFVVGGGYAHNSGDNRVVINVSAPASKRSWAVEIQNHTERRVGISSYAICAYFSK